MRRTLSILFLLVVAAGIWAVYRPFGPNTGSMVKGEYLYIHTGADYAAVKNELEQGGYINDMFSFGILADLAKYPERVKPGKYHVEHGMSNYNIIRMLRNGSQTPVRLVINKLRTKHDLSSLLGKNLEVDSADVLKMLNDPAFADRYSQDTSTIMCTIMQNTYEFYWNTSVDKVFGKIEKSFKSYWDDAHQAKAKEQGLSITEAIILASIIDEESNKQDEKPNIASTYLNRLRKGIRLQADPTIKFAVGNFMLRRITGTYLDFDSPYNTYMYTGLPPGPICTPSIGSIEAVLNAPQTDYLYFCAKPDFSGYHNFTGSYAEQMKNAHQYQQALNARGIH